jgi:hypothetical protein
MKIERSDNGDPRFDPERIHIEILRGRKTRRAVAQRIREVGEIRGLEEEAEQLVCGLSPNDRAALLYQARYFIRLAGRAQVKTNSKNHYKWMIVSTYRSELYTDASYNRTLLGYTMIFLLDILYPAPVLRVCEQKTRERRKQRWLKRRRRST